LDVKYEELRKIHPKLAVWGPNQLLVRGTPVWPDDPTYARLLGCSYPPAQILPNAINLEKLTRLREELRRDGQPPQCGVAEYDKGPNRGMSSGASPIRSLVDSLQRASGGVVGNGRGLGDTLNHLVVLDKTGLPDINCLTETPSDGTRCAPLFNYFLEYAADESFLARTPGAAESSGPKASNIFDALEKLGLHLEKSKAPREFIVIEHIERPSPN
jgi:uncharacterized protein (TIGR03435 family)